MKKITRSSLFSLFTRKENVDEDAIEALKEEEEAGNLIKAQKSSREVDHKQQEEVGEKSLFLLVVGLYL